ncbi:MAG TPA: cyclic pyranopterin monophosphate synthase MoaC [Anaerolineae bacterium]
MKLSHLDEQGRAQMVDVGAKPDSERIAIAKGSVRMQHATLDLIQTGGIPKGDVLAVARVAGIMGAKKTSDLIPMCHPLLIHDIEVAFEVDAAEHTDEFAVVNITATAKCFGKTGVEMEALTAVTTAALTVYDMVKAVDRGVRIDNVRLVFKAGGKSGEIRLE